MPASHVAHITGEFGVPAAVISLPGAQEPCVTHADRFGDEL